MRKVMLVIDDFSEMIGLESFLRRLGFDVLSLNKESLVNDALLSFQPEVVIASFRGRNIDGAKLAYRLKRAMNPPPRIALAYSGPIPQLAGDTKKSIEAMVEIPVEATSAIQMLAQLSGLSVQPLLEKYSKMAGAVLSRDEQVVIISGKSGSKPASGSAAGSTSGSASTARTERSNRYDAYLIEHSDEKADKVLPHDKAARAMARLKKDSESEKDELDRIHKEKQAYAKALFEMGKEKK